MMLARENSYSRSSMSVTPICTHRPKNRLTLGSLRWLRKWSYARQHSHESKRVTATTKRMSPSSTSAARAFSQLNIGHHRFRVLTSLPLSGQLPGPWVYGNRAASDPTVSIEKSPDFSVQNCRTQPKMTAARVAATHDP